MRASKIKYKNKSSSPLGTVKFSTKCCLAGRDLRHPMQQAPAGGKPAALGPCLPDRMPPHTYHHTQTTPRHARHRRSNRVSFIHCYYTNTLPSQNRDDCLAGALKLTQLALAKLIPTVTLGDQATGEPTALCHGTWGAPQLIFYPSGFTDSY